MEIVLPGIPIPRMAHAHSGKFTYDPQKQELESARKTIYAKTNRLLHSPDKEIAIEASRIARADNFEVSLYFGFPLPKNLSQAKINAILWHGADHNVKPDCDNLQKFYFDALKGIVFPDDAQISCIKIIKKKYDLNPRTVILIRERRKMTLDAETQAILSKLSPDEFSQITKDLHDVILSGSSLYQTDLFVDKDKNERELQRSARLISKIADLFSKPLTDIAKKYPGYWKNATE